MPESTYPAARTVAATVAAALARHRAGALARGLASPAPAVEAGAIEAVVEAAFWASLQREEGRSPKISLALIPPGPEAASLRFDRQLPLSPTALTRLAPAVERPGIHLGVWYDGDALRVWGATRLLPELCFVLEVVAPGLLVIKYSRNERYGKFGNLAVLQGDRIKLVDEQRAHQLDAPLRLAPLVGHAPGVAWLAAENVLVQLAASMRAHGHGGTLLVVPHDSRTWFTSIVTPVSYRAEPPYARLAELVRHAPDDPDERSWSQAFRRTIDGVAGLTAVDGATVIDDQYRVLAFGAKIQRADGSPSISEVVVTEPILGDEPTVVAPTTIGGTRHLSAAQFVHDQHDALALVASQDGRFTVFTWSPEHHRVRAHRIDVLLL